MIRYLGGMVVAMFFGWYFGYLVELYVAWYHVKHAELKRRRIEASRSLKFAEGFDRSNPL